MPAETHVERGPMDRQQVFELIRDRLADILEIEPSAITEGASFADDLEADSLALIELVEALEEELSERSVGLPDRRRGPRGPEDGARRRRLRRRPAVGATIDLPVPGLADLVERLGLDLAPDLLAPALVHRSWCAEHPGHPSNERLEFLGDSVLGVVVTDHVYRVHADLDEGELTEIRKTVVNSVGARRRRRRPRLGDHLLLGKGEELSGGREKPSILADAMEAIIGAVYLATGFVGAAGPRAAHPRVPPRHAPAPTAPTTRAGSRSWPPTASACRPATPSRPPAPTTPARSSSPSPSPTTRLRARRGPFQEAGRAGGRPGRLRRADRCGPWWGRHPEGDQPWLSCPSWRPSGASWRRRPWGSASRRQRSPARRSRGTTATRRCSRPASRAPR